MNVAVHTAAMAAAARKEEAATAILQQFNTAKAFAPGQAIEPDIGSAAQRVALDELQGLAVVRATGNGRYYLDRERQKERQREQGRIALMVMVGVCSILASAIALVALT